MTTFREFWARSQNGGRDESRGARVFSVVIQMTFRQLRNGPFSPNWSRNVVRCPVAKSIKTFSKLFTFTKSEIENRSNRHLTHNRLQVTGCIAERYCLLHVVVQGPGSFEVWCQLFSTTNGCGATGRQSCPIFRILAYFPHTKPLKRSFR